MHCSEGATANKTRNKARVKKKQKQVNRYARVHILGLFTKHAKNIGEEQQVNDSI